MNILFLYSNTIIPTRGGVQRVTAVLADYFEKKGHLAFYLSLTPSSEYSNTQRQFLLPNKNCFTATDNINYFICFLKDKKIDIVINQGGIDPQCSSLAYYCKEAHVKLISVVHSSPLASIYHFSSSNFTSWKKKNISFFLPLTDVWCIKKYMLWLYKQKYKKHYTDLCVRSNYVFLLSDNYKSEMAFFIGSDIVDNIIGMPNPNSFVAKTTTVAKKELLYVGRIDTSQKRVDLLLKIWKKVHLVCPDWTLRIVGGGEELGAVIRESTLMGLTNVYFEGFQDPQAYYEKSSIFCMTSSFEGFAMVLIEAMQYGVIPFAFNSFSSITDIIDSDENGMLVEPFEIDKYAAKLIKVMNNDELRRQLSEAAIYKSKEFSIEIIGERWIKSMNILLGRENK